MTDKPTAQSILATAHELWLNSPIDYPFVEKIEKHELGRLKGFLINTMTEGNDMMAEDIRNAAHETIINIFLANNFTFDPEWFGYRPLPKGENDNTRPISRLDDPNYRRSIGLAS